MTGEAFQGEAEKSHAHSSIKYSRRTGIGLELQEILNKADRFVLDKQYDEAHAEFILGNNACSFRFTKPESLLL